MNARALILPRRAVGDPYYASVVFLCSFDGADGATSALDEKGHALTFAGNAQLDTAQSRFGGASLLLDGSGDWISVADNDDWYFPAEFTIEGWFRPNFTSGNCHIMCIGGSSPNSSLALRYDYLSGSQKRVVFSLYPTGASTPVMTLASAYENIDQSVFHYVAVSRDASNAVRLFLDGALKNTLTQSGGFNASVGLRIGVGLGNVQPWNGWIDEIRITKGVCRYTAAFAVPTAAFPRG
jgi:hypothetical protein